MSDTTYSVKIDEELKDKIITAIKNSGATGKEFFTKLIEIYETQNEGHETHVKEFAELEGHLSRIKALCFGLVDDSKLEIEAITSELNKKLDEKDKEISSLREQLKALSDELSKAKALNGDIANERDSIGKTAKDLEEKIATNSELLKEYREKINKLELEIRSYEKVKKENETLTAEIEEYKSKLAGLTKEKEEFMNKAENLRLDLERSDGEHKKEIENLAMRSKMEHQTDIMKERQDCQDRLRITMDEQRKQFEEYNSTIKKLYSQIDDMRNTILLLKTKNTENNTKNGGI